MSDERLKRTTEKNDLQVYHGLANLLSEGAIDGMIIVPREVVADPQWEKLSTVDFLVRRGAVGAPVRSKFDYASPQRSHRPVVAMPPDIIPIGRDYDMFVDGLRSHLVTSRQWSTRYSDLFRSLLDLSNQLPHFWKGYPPQLRARE